MKPRTPWLGRPLLSLAIGAVWLLLQQDVSVMQLLTATALGLLLPRLLDGFLGQFPPPRVGLTALRLVGIVLWDIVVSNIAVAKLALDPRATPRPLWVPVPLDTRDGRAIAWFASIITMTPGTVSCVIDESRREILVHALDGENPAEMAAQMKARYERPLMEIFG